MCRWGHCLHLVYVIICCDWIICITESLMQSLSKKKVRIWYRLWDDNHVYVSSVSGSGICVGRRKERTNTAADKVDLSWAGLAWEGISSLLCLPASSFHVDVSISSLCGVWRVSKYIEKPGKACAYFQMRFLGTLQGGNHVLSLDLQVGNSDQFPPFRGFWTPGSLFYFIFCCSWTSARY